MSSTQIMHIGQYRLLNVVYTGQTSRTWQAYDDRARRYVGVKTLLQSASRDRSQVNMMKWEYSVGSKLQHERFAEIYEMGKYNMLFIIDKAGKVSEMTIFLADNAFAE